jgi:hypothetical protein
VRGERHGLTEHRPCLATATLLANGRVFAIGNIEPWSQWTRAQIFSVTRQAYRSQFVFKTAKKNVGGFRGSFPHS